MSSPPVGAHAVVIGAGMGGLSAAAAVAGHFGRVTVLDRDSLPAAPSHRAGTPQSKHLHVLLAGGMQALCELLPGFEEDLIRAGAVPLRGGIDIRTERPGFDPFPARDVNIRVYAMSRPLLEFTLRERLGKTGNIEIRSTARVTEIVPSSDGARATGARVDEDGKAAFLAADLVIDSSGRGVPTTAFLEATARQQPEETQIGVNVGYTTASYRVPRDQSRPWKAVLHLPQAPGSSRGGLLYPMEDDQWILALGGRGDEVPPGDEAGFLNWTRLLRTPTIFDAISGAERTGELVRYAFPKSVRRHFARLPSFPAGLVPLGDAICVFNPIYGQGMSVAAQEAVLLRRLLQNADAGELPGDLAAAFFSEVEPILETPWAMAALPDLVYPSTTGDRPSDFAQTLQFGAALTRLAAREPDVHKTMAEVANLLKPRSVYREPGFMSRVLTEMAAR